MVLERKCGAWLGPELSVARTVTERMMVSMDLDPTDFRLRDRLVSEIGPVIDGFMDAAHSKALKELKKAIEDLKRSNDEIKTHGID